MSTVTIGVASLGDPQRRASAAFVTVNSIRNGVLARLHFMQEILLPMKSRRNRHQARARVSMSTQLIRIARASLAVAVTLLVTPSANATVTLYQLIKAGEYAQTSDA